MDWETLTVGGLLIMTWVIAIRLGVRLTRDIARIIQRIAYLEGKVNGRPPPQGEDL